MTTLCLASLLVLSLPAIPESSVVRVDRVMGDSRANGSGVVIANDGHTALVLTNRHVAVGHENLPGRCFVRISGHRIPIPAEVVAVDGRADLACVRCRAERLGPAVPLAKTIPAVGQTLHHVAFPGGFGPCRQEGVFIGERMTFTDTGANSYGLRMDSQQGDSGSPVFTADGKLAGIVWGGRDKNTRFHAADELRRFVGTLPGKPGPVVSVPER